MIILTFILNKYLKIQQRPKVVKHFFSSFFSSFFFGGGGANFVILHASVTQFMAWCYYLCVIFSQILHTYVTWLCYFML